VWGNAFIPGRSRNKQVHAQGGGVLGQRRNSMFENNLIIAEMIKVLLIFYNLLLLLFIVLK
jgi:hypothetical protein